MTDQSDQRDRIDDRELRARFRALAEADRAAAPPFAIPRPARRRVPAWWMLAAAAVVLAAATLSRPRLGRRPATVATPSISDWRSPTASLMPSMRFTMTMPSDILHGRSE